MTIVVRRATTKDAGAFARMMAEPGIYAGLMQLPYPSEEMWSQRLADLLAPGKTDVMLVAELDGHVVGSSGLHPASTALRRRHVMTLGISVAPEAQRRGVGSALMTAICDYAERWAGALRLELTVYADNLAAIALYSKFGFVVEGTHRGYALRDGQYVDALCMARLHPRPPTLPDTSPPT